LADFILFVTGVRKNNNHIRKYIFYHAYFLIYESLFMQNTGPSTIAFLVFMVFFIIVMVTFIITILFYAQKKQRAYIENLVEVKATHEKEIFKTQLEIQEQTFQEISREIHDNVGQVLSLAKMGLNTLDVDKKEEARESLLEISDIIEKAIEDLRNMSKSLNTERIKKGGFLKSIEMQVGYIQRGGKFNIQLNVTGEPVTLSEIKEIFLFRIAQEVVNNVIRHAAASEICISLCYNNNFLELKISDNGRGFDYKDKISTPSQLGGIFNIQHRANLIQAELQIDSRIGQGTSITVITPY
jgi:two-component system, NarL family, sensor kinase